jgi:membrane associated rhomboid family serine protease
MRAPLHEVPPPTDGPGGRPPHMEPPVNPIPGVVLLLALPIVVIEAAFMLGAQGYVGGPQAVGWRLAALRDWGFAPSVLDWMIANNRWPPGELVRFVSYPFIHVGFTQTLFVVVFLLALGKMVAEVFRPWAVAVIFFASAAGGALVYGLSMSGPVPLIGGFPAVYGLIGAFTFLIWTRLAATGGPQATAFTLIGLLLAIQLLFGLLFGGNNDWIADLAGFAIGFGLSFVVSPGGWARVRARLSQR